MCIISELLYKYPLVLMYGCSVKSTFFLPYALSVLISHFAVVIFWLFIVHFDVYARSSENYAVCKIIYCIVVVCVFIFIIKCLWWIIKICFLSLLIFRYNYEFIQFSQADLLDMYLVLNIFYYIRRRDICWMDMFSIFS